MKTLLLPLLVCLQGCAHVDCVNTGLIAGERVFLVNPPNHVAMIKAIDGPSSHCPDPRYPIQADLIR